VILRKVRDYEKLQMVLDFSLQVIAN